MNTCTNCHTQFEGKFCPTCGTPAAAANAAPPPPAYQAPAYQTAPATAGMSDNTVCGLCYLAGFVTGVIFLVLEPYNKNPRIKFHAFQSIIFHGAFIVLMIGLTIVGGIVAHLLGFLGFLFGIFQFLLWLAGFIGWLFLMIKAFGGSNIVAPVIGPIAQQQSGWNGQG